MRYLSEAIVNIRQRVQGVVATDFAVQQLLEGAKMVGKVQQWDARPILPDDRTLRYYVRFDSSTDPATIDVEPMPI